MRRKTERRGAFGKPHPAPVHRFDTHAPERSKSHRTAVRAHRLGDGAALSQRFLRRCCGAPPRKFCRCYARLRSSSELSRWRTHSMNVVVERSCRRQYSSASRAPRNQFAMCADQYGLLVFSQELRGAIGDPPSCEGTRYHSPVHHRRCVRSGRLPNSTNSTGDRKIKANNVCCAP
jgi:hypothetical protein